MAPVSVEEAVKTFRTWLQCPHLVNGVTDLTIAAVFKITHYHAAYNILHQYILEINTARDKIVQQLELVYILVNKSDGDSLTMSIFEPVN